MCDRCEGGRSAWRKRAISGILPRCYMPPSSSGRGHRPFKAATRVRFPLGVPRIAQPRQTSVACPGFFMRQPYAGEGDCPQGDPTPAKRPAGWALRRYDAPRGASPAPPASSPLVARKPAHMPFLHERNAREPCSYGPSARKPCPYEHDARNLH